MPQSFFRRKPDFRQNPGARASPPICPEIIIAGPPNSGKTTLFNHLTGRKNKTVNYPGSTALVSTGFIQEKYNLKASVIDTPGTYSLFSPSEEAAAANRLLRSSKNRFACVLLAIDAGRLEARLPLLFQLKEIGFPVILILSFYDKIQSFSPSRLSRLLKIPVIPMKGLIGDGVPLLIEELKKTLPPLPPPGLVRLKAPPQQGGGSPKNPPLKKNPSLKPPAAFLLRLNRLNFWKTSSDRSEKRARSAPLLLGKPWTVRRMDGALRKARKIAAAARLRSGPGKTKNSPLFLSDKYDKFFLHPVTGPLVLTASLFALFASLFWLAAPFMSLIDGAFGAIVEAVSGDIGKPGFLLRDFLGRGVAGSFGAVLVFTPQIFILFFGIRLLEDSGYLARAVTMLDGLFSLFGLSGRAFAPFLSGYACAVPAALSVRSLPSKRERRIALFALPFMSCSARLPVYTLLLGLIFYGEAAWKPALSLSLIYFASLILGLLAALCLHRILPKKRRPPFILDLPLYQRPSLRAAFRNGFWQTKHYFTKAGPAVFLTALLIWAGTRFPLPPAPAPSAGAFAEEDFSANRLVGNRLSANGEATARPAANRRPATLLEKPGGGDDSAALSFESERTAGSYAGRLGRFMEPVFETMGIDWRTGTALIAAFAAREVFVSSLTLLFHENKGEAQTQTAGRTETEASLIGSAVRKMRQAQNSKGDPVFTSASLVALIVFFMFSLQCLSTTAVTAREQGTGFALMQLFVLNGLAYVTAAGVFQLLD